LGRSATVKKKLNSVECVAKSGELFSETTGFMTAIQNQVVCTSNYRK